MTHRKDLLNTHGGSNEVGVPSGSTDDQRDPRVGVLPTRDKIHNQRRLRMNVAGWEGTRRANSSQKRAGGGLREQQTKEISR